VSVPPPRVRLTRGLAGEYISSDGRWRVTPAAGGGYRLADSFKRAQFEYRPETWAIPAPTLYAARAFINGYLAGLYRSAADALPGTEPALVTKETPMPEATAEPRIRRMLDASTGSLPEPVFQALDGHPWIVVHPTGYGALMWVPDDPADSARVCDPPVPAEVLAVQMYARSLGCDYVMFDADAGPLPGLPSWEW
jgi:hypothetical protein